MHRLNLTMPTPSLKVTYPQPSLTPTLHLSAHLFAVRSPHSTAPSLHAQPALMHCSWGRFWGLRNAQASPGSGFVEDMVPAANKEYIKELLTCYWFVSHKNDTSKLTDLQQSFN